MDRSEKKQPKFHRQVYKAQEAVKQNNARIKKAIEVLEYSNKKGGVRRKGTKNQETNWNYR